MLFGIGALSLRRTVGLAEVPYAAIPIIFAVHQLVEGWLWLALPGQLPSAHILTILYLLVSNVFWPVFGPAAIWLIEPRAMHRKWLLLPVAAGVGIGLFFLMAIISQPVSAAISGSHIAYDLPHPQGKIAFAFYAVATCLAPLMSSHKLIRLFGLVLIASMIASYTVYTLWFASVWCFFAALLSAVVFSHFWRQSMPRFDLAAKQSA